MFDKLPIEILPIIFSNLDCKTLFFISFVSKKCYLTEKKHENDLWKKFLNNRCQNNSNQPYKTTFFKNPLTRRKDLIFIDSTGKKFQESVENIEGLIKKWFFNETPEFFPFSHEKIQILFYKDFLKLVKNSRTYAEFCWYYDNSVFVETFNEDTLKKLIDVNPRTIFTLFNFLDKNPTEFPAPFINEIIEEAFKKDWDFAVGALDKNARLFKHCYADPFFEQKIQALKEDPDASVFFENFPATKEISSKKISSCSLI